MGIYLSKDGISYLWSKIKNKFYIKPSTGIPKSDLASSVQTSLGKADTALQKHQDISGKVDNTAAGADSLLSKITNSWTATPTDNTYFIRQDTSSKNEFGRVKFSTLWSYIKSKVESLGYTKNTGTITGIKMNGASKGTSGVVDLGTVITVHQDISGKQDKSTAVTHTANTAVGSTAKPVYIAADGKATPITHSVNSDVPSNAKFTDTVYTHPTTAGNKHIPAGGSSGQILRWSADGTAVWGADNNTTYGDATQSAHGLMTAADKKKLDGMDLSKYLPKDGTAKKAEAMSNGTLRSGFYVNAASNATSGYVWFRMATCKISGAYETVNTTFLITNGMEGHALLSCGIRNNGTGKAVETCTLLLSARNNSDMQSGMFRVVAINSDTGATYELWGQISARWRGVRYTVLDERSLSGGKYNIWKLESHSDADAKTAPTTGNMHVDSRDSSVCATATNASNATTWHGLIDDTQTKNSADSCLLVKIGNKIQHRLSSELVVKEAATLTDSGWVDTTRNISFTKISTVKCRKYGQLVEVRGAVSFSNINDSPIVCTLPDGYCPASLVQTCGYTPSGKIFGIKVVPAGIVSFVSDSRSTFVKDTTYRVDLTYLLG